MIMAYYCYKCPGGTGQKWATAILWRFDGTIPFWYFNKLEKYYGKGILDL